MSNADGRIVLAHGGGGELTQRLLAEHVFPKLGNELLDPLTDSAVLDMPGGKLCMTTDAFVVQPLEFAGGNIGDLAVCGTVNDLAVMGAEPRALSLAMIIEEGLELSVLDRIVDSIAAAAERAGVVVATGDTKVIERGRGDGMMITTAGVGMLREDVNIDVSRVTAGDVIIINGNIADHGLAVMARREGLAFDTQLASDVAPLNGLIADILATGADVKFMRDPTRSGPAGLLADLAAATQLSIEIDEAAIPISAATRHAAELLGIDPLTVANEGKCVMVVAPADAERVLAACHAHPLGRAAMLIGRVVDTQPALVELVTLMGGRRIIQRPYGEELPRIC
jgi:hydrogenase expression/formation protein HypE